MKNAVQYSGCIVGAGPAGLAAALCLAEQGISVALVGPPPPANDNRTAALFTSSVQLLRNLGVWRRCYEGSEPLTGIRIVDDMGGLLRAPEVMFTAQEVGLDTFGYNVPNVLLVNALRQCVEAQRDTITVFETASVAEITVAEQGARITLSDGTEITASLVVGADGRNSLCRRSAGIATHSWGYEQSALTCTFMHGNSHHHTSTEFHRPSGPLTVVPGPGHTSNLVWVERPAVSRRLTALDDDAFRGTLEARLQGLLGPIENVGPRHIFPLSGLTADVAGANRVALVGEAAHVIPPIGAQGLNLGLRDAAVLADCARAARHAGHALGEPDMLAAYARARRPDIASRAWSIDLLNRSLISDVLPVQLLRGLGLHALKAINPLRRLAIREGLSPSFVTPRLMQQTPAQGTPPLDVQSAALASPQD